VDRSSEGSWAASYYIIKGGSEEGGRFFEVTKLRKNSPDPNSEEMQKVVCQKMKNR